MKRVIPIIAILSLVIGSLSMVACSSSEPPHGATAGGNGEFGESPARAGSYQSNSSSDQAASQHRDTAGGNGAFGENPARPGDYQPANQSGNTPATNPTAAPQ